MAKDPICGMEVSPGRAVVSLETPTGLFHFCSEACAKVFVHRMEGPGGTRPPHAKDPVCGMTLHPDPSLATFDWKGRRYWFCSEACQQKFAPNPVAFLHPPEFA